MGIFRNIWKYFLISEEGFEESCYICCLLVRKDQFGRQNLLFLAEFLYRSRKEGFLKEWASLKATLRGRFGNIGACFWHGCILNILKELILDEEIAFFLKKWRLNSLLCLKIKLGCKQRSPFCIIGGFLVDIELINPSFFNSKLRNKISFLQKNRIIFL